MNNIASNDTAAAPSQAGTIRRFYAALEGGDMTTAAALLAPGIVLHVPGRHPLAGDYRGLEGVGRFAALSRAVATGGVHTSVLDVMTGDDHVATLCRVDARRPGNPTRRTAPCTWRAWRRAASPKSGTTTSTSTRSTRSGKRGSRENTMRILSTHIRALMLVSGVLTSTMLYAALFPAAALQSTFGEALNGPAAEMVVRNWGVLIFLMGALLVRGAFDPAVRDVALLAAGTSKAAFIALVLAGGPTLLAHGAAVPVIVDSVMVALFAAYLVSERRGILKA